MVYLTPTLTRKQDTSLLLVIGYAIENIGIDITLRLGQQALTINNSLDNARRRIDNDNLIAQIDICPYLAINPLQLIEKIYSLTGSLNRYIALVAESLGVDLENLIAAIREV